MENRNGMVTEVVEAQGHLIDSHIMERIFDTVVEFQGKFEVENFQIGRTNSEPSRLRLKIEAERTKIEHALRMTDWIGPKIGIQGGKCQIRCQWSRRQRQTRPNGCSVFPHDSPGDRKCAKHAQPSGQQ